MRRTVQSCLHYWCTSFSGLPWLEILGILWSGNTGRKKSWKAIIDSCWDPSRSIPLCIHLIVIMVVGYGFINILQYSQTVLDKGTFHMSFYSLYEECLFIISFRFFIAISISSWKTIRCRTLPPVGLHQLCSNSWRRFTSWNVLYCIVFQLLC